MKVTDKVFDRVKELHGFGASVRQIAQDLNSRGCKTEKGCSWRPKGVWRIIHAKSPEELSPPKMIDNRSLTEMVEDLMRSTYEQMH